LRSASTPPAQTLDASATVSLGALQGSASATIDLPRQQAGGALLLRDPDAIALLSAFGIKGGWDWPGPGSASLRASVQVSPTGITLPNAVLSFGRTTANGTIALAAAPSGFAVNGTLNADTLDLPAPAPAKPLPWPAIAGLTGKLTLNAGSVLAGLQPLLGPSAATFTFAPGNVTLTLPHATLAGGDLAGTLSATGPAGTTPPALTAALQLTGVDASQIGIPVAFPFSLASGTTDATASLTAQGFSPQSWLQTLGGTLSLGAKSGSITGFDLAALGKAKPGTAAARAAREGGSTAFDRLDLAGTIAHGVLAIPSTADDNGPTSAAAPGGATLSGPAGTATADGSIDLADRALDLHLHLAPTPPKGPEPALAPPPPPIVSLSGSWQAPRRTLAPQSRS
jgi:AsmA-like C-terminal region